MTGQRPNMDTVRQWLADEAVGNIDPADRHALDAVRHEIPDTETQDTNRAAAAMHLAMVGADADTMPDDVRRRLRGYLAGVATATGAAALAPEADTPAASEADASMLNSPITSWFARPWAGWVAAAACLIIALLPFLRGVGVDHEAARSAFIRETPNVLVASWKEWDNPEIPGVTGDVSWSEEEQRGYLRFKDLPANNASELQYQLWIIDSRGMEQRVSGGIFDVPSGAEEFVCPIDPAVKIQTAQAFALTIEDPGGVWVSDMSRRVVIAELPLVGPCPDPEDP